MPRAHHAQILTCRWGGVQAQIFFKSSQPTLTCSKEWGGGVRVILIPKTLKQGLLSFAEGSSYFLTTPMAGPKEVVLFGHRHLTLNHPEVFRASLFLWDGEAPPARGPQGPGKVPPQSSPTGAVCLPVRLPPIRSSCAWTSCAGWPT